MEYNVSTLNIKKNIKNPDSRNPRELWDKWMMATYSAEIPRTTRKKKKIKTDLKRPQKYDEWLIIPLNFYNSLLN